MATPLGRLPVWRRQSTLSPAAFRMLSWPVAGSASLARITWLPPRLTIRNVSPAALASMCTMSLPNVLLRLGGGGGGGGLLADLNVQVPVRKSGPHFQQGRSVHDVDESLHVRRCGLRWLGLGAAGRE